MAECDYFVIETGDPEETALAVTLSYVFQRAPVYTVIMAQKDSRGNTSGHNKAAIAHKTYGPQGVVFCSDPVILQRPSLSV
jgi:hypothetical protein